jgi:hypothetical protein
VLFDPRYVGLDNDKVSFCTIEGEALVVAAAYTSGNPPFTAK